ncbi:MAG: hypothetical protein PVI43_02740, partial [Candidatus Bathyarchaeota archaeon]
ASWAITFNGQTRNSIQKTIKFNAVNGVYLFSVKSPENYTASPASGAVKIKDANLNQQIYFNSTIRDSPWPAVILFSAGVALIALTLASLVLYRRKH